MQRRPLASRQMPGVCEQPQEPGHETIADKGCGLVVSCLSV